MGTPPPSTSSAHDILVVGAGPAGSMAARTLAQAGMDVALIERETLPRYKTCGGGLVGRAVARLPEGVAHVFHRTLTASSLNLPHANPKKTVSFTARRATPVVITTMREELDAALADMAGQAGAQLITGTPVTAVDEDADGVTVHTAGGAFRAAFVIGADGVNGVTARHAPWAARLRTIPAVEWELPVDGATLSRFADACRFDFGVVPAGYGWVFPKKEHLSVGVLTYKKKVDLHHTMTAYLSTLGLPGAEHAARHGHRIPVDPGEGPKARGRILLCGDAAGLADAVTGEGISYALQSGRLAAQALVEGEFKPHTAADHYNRALAQQVLPELAASRLLARMIYEIPGAAAWSIRKYGEEIVANMADIVAGEATYRDVIERAKREGKRKFPFPLAL